MMRSTRSCIRLDRKPFQQKSMKTMFPATSKRASDDGAEISTGNFTCKEPGTNRCDRRNIGGRVVEAEKWSDHGTHAQQSNRQRYQLRECHGTATTGKDHRRDGKLIAWRSFVG